MTDARSARMGQRGKSISTERDERIEAAKQLAREQRVALGLPPDAPEDLEYEANRAAVKAKRKKARNRRM